MLLVDRLDKFRNECFDFNKGFVSDSQGGGIPEVEDLFTGYKFLV